MELDTIIRDGRLALDTPLPFPEGTPVHVVIESRPHIDLSKVSPDPREAARLIAEIAALPEENPGGFSGRDHDRVLYSREAQS